MVVEVGEEWSEVDEQRGTGKGGVRKEEENMVALFSPC